MTEIGLGVLIFTGIVLVLVALILLARSWLIPAGQVTIGINNDPEKELTVDPGGKLLVSSNLKRWIVVGDKKNPHS